MVLTRKFSQFVPQNVNEVVGLTAGANSIGPNTGGGGGGSGAVTQVITQGNTFTIGQWVRFDVAANMYVLALATTPLNAEVIGVVIVASPTQFTVQQSGYITSTQVIFAGLIPGEPQFLDDVIPGNMINVDVLIDGEVSRPVFVPDSPSSGWVLPYRGIIAGGGIDIPNAGPAPVTDTSIVTVVQNLHGFNPGDWLRVETPTVGPNQVHYVKAIATTLANSQAVGVVIEVINFNQFKLQFSGYVATDGTIFAPFQDQAAALLVPRVVYYLSATVAGELSPIDPATLGFISKPLYIPEQTVGTVTTNAGYILPQRPLNLGLIGPNTQTITQPIHGFAVGDWLYIQADSTYALGNANAFASSQVVGVVISTPDANTFVIQTSGYNTGSVTVDDALAPLLPANVYYLSVLNPGAIQNGPPIVVGQFTKPLYIQQTNATATGVILEQRPLAVTNAVGPGTGWSLISTTNIINQPFVNILNMAGFYRYMIIFENVIPVNNSVALNFTVSADNGLTFDTTLGDYSWNGVQGFAGTFNTADNKINIVGDYIPGRLTNIVVRGGLSGELYTINPANNLYWKTFYFTVNYALLGNNGEVNGMYSQNGLVRNILPVNALQFFMTGGNIASGVIKLLGTNV